MIEALQLRVSGVAGPRERVQARRRARRQPSDAAMLAEQARPAARERRRLGRPLQRAVDGRAEGQGRQRRRRSGVRTSSRTATSSREQLDGRSADRGSAARRRATTPTGLHGTNIVETKALPSGKVLSQTQQNTVNGVSTEPRVRRHDPGLRRLPGGRHQGDADDPEDQGADREDADDRPDQPGPDEDRHVLESRRGAVRDARRTSTST